MLQTRLMDSVTGRFCPIKQSQVNAEQPPHNQGMKVISTFLVAQIVLLLINPMVALVFALPFLAPLLLTEPLARFLAIPVIFASVVTPIAVWAGINLLKLHWHWPATAALIFLAAFFGSADLYSRYRIIEAAHSVNADCYYTQSFFQSVRGYSNEHAESEHAIYTKDGRLHMWSYKRMKFQPSARTTSLTGRCTRTPTLRMVAAEL